MADGGDQDDVIDLKSARLRRERTRLAANVIRFTFASWEFQDSKHPQPSVGIVPGDPGQPSLVVVLTDYEGLEGIAMSRDAARALGCELIAVADEMPE